MRGSVCYFPGWALCVCDANVWLNFSPLQDISMSCLNELNDVRL